MPLRNTADHSPSHWQAIATLTFAIWLTLAVPSMGQVDLGEINPFGDAPAEGEDAAADGEAEAGAENEQRTVEEVYQECETLVDEEKYDEAIPLLSQIISASPQYVPAALLRGRAFSEIGEKQLALESLGLAVNYGIRFPGNFYVEALKERGKVLMELGSFEEAADDFAMAVQSAPSNPEYLFLRGKAYARLAQSPTSSYGGGSGDYLKQAISSLTRAIAVKEDYAEAYAERGNVYSLSNRFEDSVADFQKAVSIDGETTNYKAQHGFILLRRAEYRRNRPNADKNQIAQDYQSAISAFTEYLAVEGNKDKKDFEDAGIDIFRPSQVYLGRASAQVSLANELGGAGQRGLYEAAAADADKAYEFDENTITAVYQKGVAQRLMGDLEKAAQTFTDVLDISPSFTEANIRRGICYYYLGEYEAARRDFERAVAFSESRDGRPQFWMGVTSAKEGDYETAIRHYSRAIRLNPRYKPAYSNRGLAFMQMKQYRRAAGDFDELLRRNRKDSVARQRRDQAKQMMMSR